jgi:hypothetical protein
MYLEKKANSSSFDQQLTDLVSAEAAAYLHHAVIRLGKIGNWSWRTMRFLHTWNGYVDVCIAP